VAVIILLFSPVQINSLYGFLGLGELPSYVGPILTAVTVIVITNSFNLIDGLDGLAACIGLLALTAFGIWFFVVGDPVYALYCFAMIGGILAFLVFNWEPSDIFMGDTGAMVIGMLLAILLIHFMSVNNGLPPTHPFKYTATIASAAAFIIIPLCDTLRIIILRLSKGQSPVKPDKSHIHHALIRLGLSHARTVMILGSVNALYILGAFFLRSVPDLYMIPGIIVFAMVLSLILDRLIVNKLSTKVAPHD
jgi:UDP-GlcNAc:undecaprenyl-phosphate/decaprenyl-phosphate GlcNAc-1-phosphate transferase